MPEATAFNSQDAARAWNSGAEAWDEFVESGANYYQTEVHVPALLDICGEVQGLRVLDLGCGQGYLTRHLASKGATVTGVDVSERQIEYARQYEAQSSFRISYAVIDAARVSEQWPEGSFDVVTSCMALQDMPEPGKTLQSARKVLKDSGRMVFSIPHPVSNAPFGEWERDENGRKTALKLDRYFDSGPRLFRWNMDRLKYHWENPYWLLTLTEWSQLISGAGFLIRRIYEPRPTEEQVRRLPHLSDSYRVPYFMIFDLTTSR